ncbi:putative alpha/beta hydrolase [Talaromyces proteolyticus]|uniref:Alpha/beta hydrolase n=1 Tax=Talaromyces proteolyticus TaxID=1131652 RepID=A0AAD4KRU4_9EURO|nr:putative alpha/beta hydrolase [Talaromyces proteolyticus]KAH8695132.1 putative alpha/beta hydrolase [Talaromyces proteolyticus]
MSEWEISTTKSDLVSIGTHQLFVSVSGPIRHLSEGSGVTTKDPVVICFPGSGESSSSWPRVQEGVSKFARIVLYDRSGLGRSDEAPDLPGKKAVAAAKELYALLKVTQISGPYILVAHSYGAIIAREFLHLSSDDVAGMVLADGATERQPEYFHLPDPNIDAVLGNLNFAEITGLKAGAQLSRDEWKTRAIDIFQRFKAYASETAAFYEVCATLREKKQLRRKVLGSRPLSIVKCCSAADYEKIYEAGVRAGNGTPEQQQKFRQWLDGWDNYSKMMQKEVLQLSTCSRWVDLPDCGHNINLWRPDVLVRETQWVIQNMASKPSL